MAEVARKMDTPAENSYTSFSTEEIDVVVDVRDNIVREPTPSVSSSVYGDHDNLLLRGSNTKTQRMMSSDTSIISMCQKYYPIVLVILSVILICQQLAMMESIRIEVHDFTKSTSNLNTNAHNLEKGGIAYSNNATSAFNEINTRLSSLSSTFTNLEQWMNLNTADVEADIDTVLDELSSFSDSMTNKIAFLQSSINQINFNMQTNFSAIQISAVTKKIEFIISILSTLQSESSSSEINIASILKYVEEIQHRNRNNTTCTQTTNFMTIPMGLQTQLQKSSLSQISGCWELCLQVLSNAPMISYDFLNNCKGDWMFMGNAWPKSDSYLIGAFGPKMIFKQVISSNGNDDDDEEILHMNGIDWIVSTGNYYGFSSISDDNHQTVKWLLTGTHIGGSVDISGFPIAAIDSFIWTNTCPINSSKESSPTIVVTSTPNYIPLLKASLSPTVLTMDLILCQIAAAMKIPDWQCDTNLAPLQNTSTWSGLRFHGGTVTGITYTSLSVSGFTTSIPTAIGYLTGLEYLILNSNKLSRNIPSEIGLLTALTHLRLDENKLIGTIPTSIGYLTHLISLNLDGNKLSGSIPSTIGYLLNMNFLIASNNYLEGSLPTSIQLMTSLITLALEHNTFSRFISEELFSHLESLRTIYLFHNMFTGPIPSSLCTLSNLQRLTLFDNSFNCYPNCLLNTTIKSDVTRIVNLPMCS